MRRSGTGEGAREDPVARALAYPYPREDRPVLFEPREGSHRRVRLAGIGAAGEGTLHRRPVSLHDLELTGAGGATVLRDRVAVVASGSNASVAQLARKWTGQAEADTILVAPARLAGVASVYSAHITAYGAVPATVHPAEGVVGLLHLMFVSRQGMELLDASESIGVNYLLAEIPATAETEGGEVVRPLAYVSRRGALIQDDAVIALAACAHEGAAPRALSEPEMLDAVRRRLGFEDALGPFVTRLVEDAEYRAKATAALARGACRWELNPEMIVAGGD